MNIQYITDGHGNKSGVLLPINDWEKIQHDLNELKELKGTQEKKLSARLRGSISKERAKELNEQLSKMRSEWQERNT
jgi:hypothetical protein